jgi:hypothetical protein
MTDINSQEQNLLGNQIFPKSGDFCILEAILDSKWLHMVTILVCYGGTFESKMATKIQKSSDLKEIWFPSRL